MVVAVTHDRYFLDEVAEWILELDRGGYYPYEGNYSGWLEQKRKRLAQEEKEESARQRQLAEESEWVKADPAGPSQEGQGPRVAPTSSCSTRTVPSRSPSRVIMIPDGPRLGDIVVDAEGVTKGYGDKLLYEDLYLQAAARRHRGDHRPERGRQDHPDAHDRHRGRRGPRRRGDPPGRGRRCGSATPSRCRYVDQSRADLAADKTVFEEITGGMDWVQLGPTEMASRAYVAAFGFKSGDQQKKVGSCSGGERNRIHLAKLLQNEANLLLLDEPTNDLDVDTLRALEEALLEFAGCAVITSHDRWFLDRVATHILAFEGDSEAVLVRGVVLRVRARTSCKRKGEDALNPTRIKYKPLERRVG